MPDDDANQAFFDALLRHQIYLLRFSGSVRKRIEALLNGTEQELAEKIRDRLRNMAGGVDTPAEVRRLETLLGIVENIRTRAWRQIDEVWAEELVGLAGTEPNVLSKIILTTSPVVIDTILPTSQRLRTIATSTPFEGKTLRQWASTIRREDINRIQSAVRQGMIQGETPQQIARLVVGTARLKGRDGVTEITRRNAAAITRTAVNHIANEARTEFFKENSDIVSKERFVATLDSRTTPRCRALDGKIFDLGKGPRPPLHFNCRSLRVAVLDAEALAERPAKASTEQGLLRDFAARQGLDKTPRSRSDLPRGTKGAFDKFARQRVRELTGRVPGDTSYQDWLKRQPAAFQDDVLGKAKGRLFRQGGLRLDQFVNRNGDELTLGDLAKRHADSFRAAGLDPGAFRR